MSANALAVPSVLSGRYAIFGEIASGGMASVLYGRLLGPVGFARPVAIKRLHPHIAREPDFVSMFIDEARICARVSHANVVPTLDVIEAPGELSLVMEYVHGCTLETLLELSQQRGESVPLGIAGGLMLGVLHGLSAAHEARGDHGEPLGIVHRDVSPQNIIVGVDGVPRLLDFGIAKARGRLRSTPSGEVKGKLAYMAPEQFRSGAVDLRVDVYSASAVLWELLVGHPLFEGQHESAVVHSVLYDNVLGPSSVRNDISPELDAIILRGLSRDPELRFGNVREVAVALESVLRSATQSEVSSWLRSLAGEQLDARAELLLQMQRSAELRAPEQLAATPSSNATRKLQSESASAAGVHESVERAASNVTTVRLRKPGALAALALIATLLLGVVIWRWSKAAQSQVVAAPLHEAQPAPPLPAPPLAPKPVEEAPVGSALPAEPASTSSSPAAAAQAKARGKRASHKDAVKTGRAAQDCSEPYVIDALGVKRWRRECL